MAREAACAFAYDLLAVYSGQGLAVCYEPGSEQGRQLAEAVCAAFDRPGYAKPIREAGRLNAARGGGPFRLTAQEWDGRRLPQPPSPAARPLGPLLRQAAERAEQGFRCGIDIGGTNGGIRLEPRRLRNRGSASRADPLPGGERRGGRAL